jgi:outer membrane receptor for ferrienterochelin and colicins
MLLKRLFNGRICGLIGGGIVLLFSLVAQGQENKKDSLKQAQLQELVITGTKTFKRKTESPVLVQVLDAKTLQQLQVCNLAEGLKFQPGLRMETDCQTCNYTQLRMNGLPGAYSQILINGRPIFSPMMGLYGMEQMPVNLIDRIEVVRGGGSSLYGSNAVGGTVNVITKLPRKNGYEVNSFYQHIDRQTPDFNFQANATLVNDSNNAGIAIHVNRRNRGMYDANGDNLSEMPALNQTALAISGFYRPSENQKLEVSLSSLSEYRYGGEMRKPPAYLALQAEERQHNIWMGSADYQWNFNKEQSALIIYAAFQQTDRTHYTGMFPDSATDIQQHIINPPYGYSNAMTWQGGFQLNHRMANWFKRRHVLTFGTEYLSDKVDDRIPTYQFLVNQHTRNWGIFLQSDWDIFKGGNLLMGLRADQHNFLPHWVLSPRMAFMYTLKTNTQFRLNYGKGFRAPQAFDTDLHIAFAGGGVSRVKLQEGLQEERARSWSASVNYDKLAAKWIAGFTVEGFYTYLRDAFILENIGRDQFGEIFQKRNGQGAYVQGLTLELRANYNKKLQLEGGFTVQENRYREAIVYMEDIASGTQFLRTPNQYAYAMFRFTPNTKWNINVNYVYTGPMLLAHFGGAENFPNDAMITTNAFSEVGTKVAYALPVKRLQQVWECYVGVKNLLNAYQDDFDKGKYRDSNYIYGPAMPRTLFIGLKMKSN